jgi:hypothetical protein
MHFDPNVEYFFTTITTTQQTTHPTTRLRTTTQLLLKNNYLQVFHASSLLDIHSSEQKMSKVNVIIFKLDVSSISNHKCNSASYL